MKVSLVELTRSEVGLVGVDEEEGVARFGFRGSDGPHIRPLAVFRGQLFQRSLDIAAADSLSAQYELYVESIAAEGEDVPGFEAFQEPWLDTRVLREEVIESRGESIAEHPQAGSGAFIFLHREALYLESSHQEIPRQRLLAMRLGGAPGGEDEVFFDLPEVVLCLGVEVSEDHARIGRPVDVRHAPGIPMDCDGASDRAPVGAALLLFAMGGLPAGDGAGQEHLQESPLQRSRLPARMVFPPYPDHSAPAALRRV